MAEHTDPAGTAARRFYRLRAPDPDPRSGGGAASGPGVAVSVRVDPGRPDLYLAVGAGKRRMYLTPAEAWALWRCLSEAVASLGDPPDAIRTPVRPTTR